MALSWNGDIGVGDTAPTRSGTFTALLPQQRTRGQCLCRSVGDSAGGGDASAGFQLKAQETPTLQTGTELL